MASAWEKSTIVVVLGSTGTGKSKLGIELAEKFNGEIISADSIQVYKGLDVCSAKVTAEEQTQAKHHLLSVAECTDNYNVVTFRDTALPIIKDVLDRGKVPIIVGGTNYYIEALIWNTLLPKAVDPSLFATEASPTPPSETGAAVDTERHVEAPPAEDKAPLNVSAPSAAVGMDGESLYERLKEVDPAMAARLHPNNTRKIQRTLEVYEKRGVTYSQLLSEQQGGADTGSPQRASLRFPKACVFWIRCDTDVLDSRLSRRVDGMMAQGMLEELSTFHAAYGASCLKDDGTPCFEKGLFQSIGYKELYPYLQTAARADGTETAGEAGKDTLLEKCLQSLVRATSRYSRKQNTWIRNRFLRAGQVLPVYGLDSSRVENWETAVLGPAASILTAQLAGGRSPILPLPVHSRAEDSWTKHECDMCNRVLHGDQEWKVHLNSRMHRMRRKKQRKRDEREAAAEKMLAAAVASSKDKHSDSENDS